VSAHRCGIVTLLGRPNVGKSTLINRLVGQKIAITSRRPQTTRFRVLGIVNRPGVQYIFVDTPGLHTTGGRALNRVMQRTAQGSLEGVDAVFLLITATGWHETDRVALNQVRGLDVPVVLVINKIDQLKTRERVLPVIEDSRQRMEFAAIVPISARTGENVEELLAVVAPMLPESPAGFPADQVTDRSERFMAGELIREQLFRLLGQELPYASAVEITRYDGRSRVVQIDANIWVDRDGQKAIVIGDGGRRIKQIGTVARKAIEELIGRRVHLDLRVKTRSGWTDDVSALHTLGYDHDK